MNTSLNSLLIIIVVLCMAAPCLAQTYLVIGGNYTTVTDAQLSLEPEFNTNPIIGLGRPLDLGNTLSLNLESTYTVRGFKVKGSFNDNGEFIPQANSNYRIHYLNLDPTIDLKANKHLSIIGGGYGSVKLLETLNDLILEDLELPLHRSIDYGLTVGAKAFYQNYFLRLLVQRGLTNLLRDNPANLSYRNLNVQLVLGFTFSSH